MKKKAKAAPLSLRGGIFLSLAEDAAEPQLTWKQNEIFRSVLAVIHGCFDHVRRLMATK